MSNKTITTKRISIKNRWLPLAALGAWLLSLVIGAQAQTAPIAAPVLTEPEIWVAAGDVRQPENRAGVVLDLERLENQRKATALEQARELGLPLRVELPDGRVRELMDWFEGRPLYYTTLNRDAAISTASDQIRVAPYLADGAGWTVGVWDGGGVRPTHQEFGGRVTIMDGAGLNNHATHVGGTIGAAGVTASAIGMARAVTIHSYDWNSDVSEMSSRGASYGGEPEKIYVSNHSYGYISGWYRTGGSSPAWVWYGSGTVASAYDPYFGQYNTYTRDIDVRAYNLPYYLIFWAAGNDRSDNPPTGSSVALDPNNQSVTVSYDPALHPPGDGTYKSGYDTISFSAVAKNVITVGAVNDAVTSGMRDLSKATMTTFSSWGPTDDGRIKPDVVANGASLYSTVAGGDTSYGWMSGTSMASPNAAGTAQQLIAYYGALFPGQYLRASSLKGLLIHTADDLGTTGPNYTYGWGMINARAAADLLKAQHETPEVLRLIEQQLSTSVPSSTYSITWDGISPLKATLSWTDPAGTSTTAHDSRVSRLVNNLHLRVDGPTGSQHFPWVMPFVGDWSAASMSQPATTGVNNTDNVIQVLIPAPPAAGTYQIVVSHSGTLSNNHQDYSLLIDGAASSGPVPLEVSPDTGEQGSLAVTISGTSFAAGTVVEFFRSGYSEVPVVVSEVTPTAITGTVDLSVMAMGYWGVRVTNPDGKYGELADAFLVIGTLFQQHFESTTLPGWSTYLSLGSGASGWALTTERHTPSYAWFVPGTTSKTTDNLESEGISIPVAAERLRLHFWHKFNILSTDGGLLELWANGDWREIGATESGATFVQGGYTTTVQAGIGKPDNKSEFANKPAWNGDSGSEYTEVILALDPAVYAGQTLRVRWRFGTDNREASVGWWVDSLRLTGYDPNSVAPLSATVMLSDLDQVYDGAARSVTVVTDPPELDVSTTYDGLPALPVDPGQYAVEATVTDPNYSGSANGQLTVHPTLTVTVGVHGAITPDGVVVVPYGGDTNLLVEADPYWVIDSLRYDGLDVPAAAGVGVFTSEWTSVTAPHVISAEFLALTTTSGVPHWWLAHYGWTEDFEAVALADADGDSFAVWEEYIADTIPTNAASFFPPLTLESVPGTITLGFDPTSTERQYHVDVTTNLAGAVWSPVTNAPGTGGAWSVDIPTAAEDRAFFRGRVTLP